MLNCSHRSSRTHVFLILLLALATAPSLLSEEDKSKPDQNRAKSVELTVDYGDGAEKRFAKVPWKDGMTVLDSLIWASKHPHGIKLKYRGKKSLALVGQIDDLKNAGGGGKNWIFYVNKKLADKGCGAAKLRPSDRILWRFEEYQ